MTEYKYDPYLGPQGFLGASRQCSDADLDAAFTLFFLKKGCKIKMMCFYSPFLKGHKKDTKRMTCSKKVPVGNALVGIGGDRWGPVEAGGDWWASTASTILC